MGACPRPRSLGCVALGWGARGSAAAAELAADPPRLERMELPSVGVAAAAEGALGMLHAAAGPSL